MGAAAARKTTEKAMTSLVNWALLGLVIERSSYGLELARRFQRVYADVLPISGDSHIYTALDALVSRGLVEVVPGTEIGRQPKLRYRATQAGVRRYEDWVVALVDDERRRQELWVRQLAIFAHDPTAALHVIGRFEAQHLAGAGKTGRSSTAASDHRTELIDDLLGHQQRTAGGALLSWLQYAQERFEALVDDPDIDGASRA
jgi:DNA-binding PadR family transcriptional regulator